MLRSSLTLSYAPNLFTFYPESDCVTNARLELTLQLRVALSLQSLSNSLLSRTFQALWPRSAVQAAQETAAKGYRLKATLSYRVCRCPFLPLDLGNFFFFCPQFYLNYLYSMDSYVWCLGKVQEFLNAMVMLVSSPHSDIQVQHLLILVLHPSHLFFFSVQCMGNAFHCGAWFCFVLSVFHFTFLFFFQKKSQFPC